MKKIDIKRYLKLSFALILILDSLVLFKSYMGGNLHNVTVDSIINSQLFMIPFAFILAFFLTIKEKNESDKEAND